MLILAFLLMLFAAGPGDRPAQAAPPQPPRTPKRDARVPADKGTAVISGRVLSADGGRPLRRAQIRLSASELSRS